MISKKEKLKLALEEVRSLYKEKSSDAHYLDQKGGVLLAGSGIMIALLGGLDLPLLVPGQSLTYQIGIILIFILFAIEISLLLLALFPKEYKTVFEESLGGIDKAIINQPDDNAAINQLIVNYLARIAHNNNLNKEKANQILAASLIFGVELVFILFVSIIPH